MRVDELRVDGCGCKEQQVGLMPDPESFVHPQPCDVVVPYG